MRTFGWVVLALVFVDEVWAVTAYGVWGWGASPRWLLVWLLPALVTAAWGLAASPKAPYGGRVVRPVVKVLVFLGAVLLLLDAGHPTAAWTLLAFSVVVNALAELPVVRGLLTGVSPRPAPAPPRPPTGRAS